MAKTKSTSKTDSMPAQRKVSSHPLEDAIPRGDRVIIKREIPQKASAGGILLPDSAQHKSKNIGIVHAVGPGKYDNNGDLISIGLRKGQRVIITGYAGLEIRDGNVGRQDDDLYVILREEDVIAVIPDGIDFE